MKGKKKMFAKIAGENNIKILDALLLDLHGLADRAAIDDRDRDFYDYCACESACVKRIAELKRIEAK